MSSNISLPKSSSGVGDLAIACGEAMLDQNWFCPQNDGHSLLGAQLLCSGETEGRL